MSDRVTGVLERALDLNWVRQQMIANNIANVDTPGYKRVDVDFKSSLLNALDKNKVEPLLAESKGLSLGNDDNNVDIEQEISHQAMNMLQYSLTSRLLSDQLGMLRTAITEGRR